MNVKTLFPNASKDTVALNRDHAGTITQVPAKNPVQTPPNSKKRHSMNKTEASFALQLEVRKRAGEILRWEFQGITLRWFDMRYTPDFFVLVNTVGEKDLCELYHDHHQIKLIEVKGPHIHYRQQALARFKGARGFWPEFTFELWQRQKGGLWKHLI